MLRLARVRYYQQASPWVSSVDARICSSAMYFLAKELTIFFARSKNNQKVTTKTIPKAIAPANMAPRNTSGPKGREGMQRNPDARFRIMANENVHDFRRSENRPISS